MVVSLDEDGTGAVDTVAIPKNNDRRLDIATWQLAFDRFVSNTCASFSCSFSMPRYALAAVVLEQMSYAQAMRYKKVIMEVALTAKADDKGPFLGVLYDELIRLFSVHRFNACGRFPSLQETLG